jgi:hypothetical protein
MQISITFRRDSEAGYEGEISPGFPVLANLVRKRSFVEAADFIKLSA